MRFILPTIIVVILIIVALLTWNNNLGGTRPQITVTNFEECVIAGNPVMESYPRQCSSDGQLYIENVGNELEKTDMIRVDYPRPNQSITSPITIKGQARGNWFFEATFPIVLTDWDGKIIAQGYAQANGEWMTTEFVPFEAVLKFTVDQNTYSNKGTLILQKNNASGLPEHDDALEIPVTFTKAIVTTPTPAPTPTPEPREFCTLDAKICSDGSAVGRVGPNCDFAACPSTPAETGSTAKLNQKITNNGVSITPTQVVSDSRCPANVNCVWAGEVVVKVKLEKGNITNVVDLKEGASVSIGGKTVTLVSVAPQKYSEVITQPGDYRFTFEVR